MFEVSEAVVQRSRRPELFCTKGVIKISQNSQENTWVSFLNKVADLWETLAQVFSYGFCEIFRITFFYKTPTVAASEGYFSLHQGNIVCEYKLNGKPTMSKNKHFLLFLILMLNKPIFHVKLKLLRNKCIPQHISVCSVKINFSSCNRQN